MRKYTIWIVLGVIVILLLMMKNGYNGLVRSQESVNTAWANVEAQYQRRADLIPNLVSTVKANAEFEKSTLTQVIEARSKATSIRIDPNNMTPEKLQEFQQAQNQVGGALSRLLAVAEAYPQLQATQSFRDLQTQLESTENRINEARRQFNLAAQEYNTSLRSFPRNITANIFNFQTKPYFEADKGNEKAPKVGSDDGKF
jgi:LemA protein